MPERGTATATILFTDVVGSTAVRVDLGDARSDRLFVDHLHQLADVVLRHGGRVVESGGEGVMATFEAASQAVRAAVALQIRVRQSSSDLAVRVGIAAGDVTWEDEECFGLPVITAARLQAAAEGGQILVSHTVRLLAGDRAGDRYESIGPLELEGLPERIDAYLVGWEAPERHSQVAAPPPPMPLALCARPADPFVGRTEAMAELSRVWHDASAASGRIVLIGGEAGAGKTRLATELARRVHAGGAAVLHGGCDADLALPYQPWVHALDQVLPDLPRASITDHLGARLAPLAQLLARVEQLVVYDRSASRSDPEAERYRLYDAFIAVLNETTSRWPTLVVLDDLHWAGPQTLALLRHVAHNGVPPGLVIVGTFRDTGDEITEPLAACLADLRRVDGMSRLRLGGLDAAAVEHFVAEVTGRELDDELRWLAAGLTDRSGGNAFFVGELWRLLVSSGAVERVDDGWVVRRPASATDVPDSVREVVAERLARLSPPARELVDLAALAGQRIDLQVMALAADVSAGELEGPVGELVAAGVLAAAPTTALVYQFAHAIVRDTVEEAIAPLARRRLHLAVARAIETAYEADRRSVLAELARHYTAAVPLGPIDKAAYYGRRAASQALRSAAYDEAIAHLEAVLGLLPASTERAAVLVELGSAQLRRGLYAASRDTCTRAFRAAAELGAVDVAAHAAIGFEDARHFPGAPGGPAVELLRAALALVGDESAPLHARLLASLGRALAHTGLTAEGVEAAELATDQARAVGDPESLIVALQAIVTTIDDPARLLAAAAELADLAERRGDPWSASYALCNRFRAFIALGQLDEAAAALDEFRPLSARGRFSTFMFMAHALDVVLALAAGDFAAAEAAADRAHASETDEDSPYRAGVYGMQMYAIRRAQGRLAEVAPIVRQVAATRERGSIWQPGLAALYVELGMREAARGVFDELARDEFAAVARDAIWPACLTFLAETCIALGDVDRAAALYDELAVYHSRNLMVGLTICFGPADRLLGGLAAVLGRVDDAEEHFRAALALAEGSRSPLWVAEAQFDWAATLEARGEHAQAADLRRQALTIAHSLGIGRLTKHAPPERPELRTTPAGRPAGMSERELEILRCVAEGLSNRAIGTRLFISPNTVANHVRSILQKTGCANRTEAASYAVRSGLTGSEPVR